MNKKTLAVVVGNILEHYDQALYGFLAPVLAPLFFPATDPVYALLCAFALQPIGLIARPCGALLFGALHSRIGKATTLSLALFGMALSTTAIACLPLYATAGWLAPSLLLLCKLLQNFFSSGEIIGGALYLLEKTESKRRGWVSSLFDASGMVGILLAAIAAALAASHWRWLFAAGALSAIAALIVRKDAAEAPSKIVQTPFKGLLREWKSIVAISAVAGFSYANYYIITNFFNGFLPLVSQINVPSALSMNAQLLVLDLALLPLFGWLSMKCDRERLMKAALFAAILFSLPCFLLLDQASSALAFALRLLLVVIGVAVAAPYHAWAMEKAAPQHRFTICALGLTFGSRLIGAPIPAVSLWLYQSTGWIGSAALPVLGSALLALGAMVLLKEKQPQIAAG